MDLEYEQMGDYLIPKLKANPEPEGNGNEIRTSEGQISEGEIRWGENSNVSGRNAESTSSRDSGTGKRERMEVLTSQMAEKEGVNEQLKAQDQMLWVKKMNSIQSRAGGSRTERTDLQPTNFVKPEESYTIIKSVSISRGTGGSITAAEASKNILCPLLSICRKPILK